MKISGAVSGKRKQEGGQQWVLGMSNHWFSGWKKSGFIAMATFNCIFLLWQIECYKCDVIKHEIGKKCRVVQLYAVFLLNRVDVNNLEYSSTLAWKIPWTEEPGRLQSMGSIRVGHD